MNFPFPFLLHLDILYMIIYFSLKKDTIIIYKNLTGSANIRIYQHANFNPPQL